MHAAAYCYVRQTLKLLPAPRHVVDLGGRNVNGTVRPLIPRKAHYTVVDLVYDKSVDYVADAAEWGETGAYDLVLALEVFEHSPKAAAICANAYRILAPGGVLVVTAATVGRAEHSAVDGGPLRKDEFYCNVTAEDLARWLAPFAIVEMEINEAACDIYACAWR